MRDIIFLPIFIICLPVCFISPFFGTIMWTVVSFLNPQKLMWGIAHHIPLAELVAIPTLLGVPLFSRRGNGWRYFLTRDVVFVLILWIWFTFTTIHDTHVPLFAGFSPATWFRWTFVSKVMLMALLTAGMVNTWERFRWLLLAIAGSLGFLVVKAIPFMIMTGGASKIYGPEGSMLADNNDMGLALNMTLPIFFFLAKTETNKWIRRALVAMFCATIPAVFFTYSRGALLGLAVVLCLLVLKSRRRLVLAPVLVLAAVFALYLTPEKWQYRMDFRREGAVMDASAMDRLSAWSYSWRLAQDFPFTGAGFEAFTPGLYQIYEPEVHGAYGPHSIYFGVLAEHGFPGLTLYLLLIGSCFVSLRKAHKYGMYWEDERALNFAPMLQLSLVAFMVTGAFLGRAYFDYFFTIVACTVIITRLCKMEMKNREVAGVDQESDLAESCEAELLDPSAKPQWSFAP